MVSLIGRSHITQNIHHATTIGLVNILYLDKGSVYYVTTEEGIPVFVFRTSQYQKTFLRMMGLSCVLRVMAEDINLLSALAVIGIQWVIHLALTP